MTLHHLKEATKRTPFTRACSDRPRGNGLKLKGGRLRLGIRKKIFAVRVGQQ